MITKKVLDNVVAFELQIVRGHYEAHDVYTLRFRQWWKKDMEISFHRIVSDPDFDAGTYIHKQSAESNAFHDMLAEHINNSFNEGAEPAKPKKASVLKLIINENFKEPE